MTAPSHVNGSVEPFQADQAIEIVKICEDGMSTRAWSTRAPKKGASLGPNYATLVVFKISVP